MNRVAMVERAKAKRNAQKQLDAQLGVVVLRMVHGLGYQGSSDEPIHDRSTKAARARSDLLKQDLRIDTRELVRTLLDQGADPNTLVRDPVGQGMTRVVNALMGEHGDADIALMLVQRGAELDDRSAFLLASSAAGSVREVRPGEWKVDDRGKMPAVAFEALAQAAANTPHLDWTQLVPDTFRTSRGFLGARQFHPIRAHTAMSRYYPEFSSLLEQHYQASGESPPVVLPAVDITPTQATQELIGQLRQHSEDETLDPTEMARRVHLWLAAGADPNTKMDAWGSMKSATELGIALIDPRLIDPLLEHGGQFDDECVDAMAKQAVRKARSLGPGPGCNQLLDDILEAFCLLERSRPVDLDRKISMDGSWVGRWPRTGSIVDMLDAALPGFAGRRLAQREGANLEAQTAGITSPARGRRRF